MNTNSLTITQDVEYDFSAIQNNNNLTERTKAQYEKALRNYLATGDKLGDLRALESYASDLPKSSRAFLKAAIRMVTNSAIRKAKASATPENITTIQAIVYRVDAMNEAIQVEQEKGKKTNIWLSKEQTEMLMSIWDNDLENQRDWIILALMVGAGLRRDELVNLEYGAIFQKPNRQNQMRTVLSVVGKGKKHREIPIKEIFATRLQEWKSITGLGKIARAIRCKDKIKYLTDSISAVGVFEIVRKHGALIGVPDLAPHDLRRTYAQLGYGAGVPITQISNLLGHANIATTQRYLNLELDLDTTVSDFIPL